MHVKSNLKFKHKSGIKFNLNIFKDKNISLTPHKKEKYSVWNKL